MNYDEQKKLREVEKLFEEIIHEQGYPTPSIHYHTKLKEAGLWLCEIVKKLDVELKLANSILDSLRPGE